ncbi:MAG: hypothetical protein L3K07_03355 [Thermoplasmata archaeon]|nr:hypothetical protein [Thermoplasmata archaeon]
MEGFRSILDASDPSMRYLLRDALAPGKVPRVRQEPTSRPFVGSLVLVRPTFETRKGPFSVGIEDAGLIARYLARVAPIVERYLAPFTRVGLRTEPAPHELSVRLLSNRFCDSQVAQWLDSVAAGHPGAAGLVVVAPTSVVNSDADPSLGVRGYHALARLPYLFLNVQGTSLRLEDRTDGFALALSHHLFEMASDPSAELENPEVCDPCGATAESSCRNYFGAGDDYLGGGSEFPPRFDYAYFLHGIARKGSLLGRPLSASECGFPPPLAGSRPLAAH